MDWHRVKEDKMEYTFFLKKDATIYMGGDPLKGGVPTLTVVRVKNPQVLIDPEKGTITIIETK